MIGFRKVECFDVLVFGKRPDVSMQSIPKTKALVRSLSTPRSCFAGTTHKCYFDTETQALSPSSSLPITRREIPRYRNEFNL